MDRRRLLKGLGLACLGAVAGPAMVAVAKVPTPTVPTRVGYLAPGFHAPGVAIVLEEVRDNFHVIHEIEVARAVPLEGWAVKLLRLDAQWGPGLEWRVDRSEPRWIQFLRMRGLNAVPCGTMPLDELWLAAR